MSNENPVAAREPSQPAPQRPSLPLRLFLPILVLAALIATIPFYGYYVHAARDSQLTALVIFLSWFLTWFFAISSTGVLLLHKHPPIVPRIVLILLTLYIWIAGFVGWGGVRQTFWELVAG